ncbi:MAG TPA: hypothetical protein VL325_00995 [Pyrinomonadaceae bacterium]|nr:hypothetical protein [Pyrinomonadaceae bacterium]
MMRKTVLTITFLILVFSLTAFSQKRARLGKVCGDPKQPCSYAKNFQPFELPFDTGRNNAIASSEYFYAVVLESAKLKPDASCEQAFPESQRLAVQALFPNNKVFVVRCPEPGSNFYTNVSQDVSLMAIYAGRTLAEAKASLKKVQAARSNALTKISSTGKYKALTIRRMQAGINGT